MESQFRILLLATTAVLLAAPLVFLVPPGEAPDEPAHVAYVHHLAAEGTLPRPNASGRSSYELYQPPLAYAVMAAAVRAAGFEGVDYPFTPASGFAFQRGARAFEPVPPARAITARRALLVARSVNLAWLFLASMAILLTCRRLTASPWVALAAGAPFALAPQWLFLSAVVDNDAAVSALVAVATLGLVLVVSRHGSLVPVAASTAAGLALWTKASAVVIAPALVLAFFWLIASRRWRDAVWLLVPGLLLSAGYVLVELSRTGSVIPSPQIGWHGGSSGFARLLTDPWWLVSAWIGFWAKLGWFNVPLPAPVYLVFVPPTLAAVFGTATVFRQGTAKAGLILLAIVAANLALLGLYMARVDWQPQGRYLLPSAAALAGLATIGLDRLCRSWSERARKRLALLSCSLAAATALTALAVVVATYL